MNNQNDVTPALPDFTPVAVRPRADGWTPLRQRQFIELLADTGSVHDSAVRVGMSAESAYRLRRRFDAQSFDTAWEWALSVASRRLTDCAYERAINGVEEPVFYKGEIVGHRRVYSERLLTFLLRYHDPLRYGALSGPKPYDAQKLDARRDHLTGFPALLNKLLRRGRTIDNRTEHGV